MNGFRACSDPVTTVAVIILISHSFLYLPVSQKFSYKRNFKTLNTNPYKFYYPNHLCTHHDMILQTLEPNRICIIGALESKHLAILVIAL